jgi:hypothetical protein
MTSRPIIASVSVCLLAIGLWCLYGTSFGMEGAEQVTRVQGISDSPILRDGQSIIIKHEDFDKLKPGDLVIRRCGGELVCHPIARRWTLHGAFITRGYANDRDDTGYLTRDNYVATVVYVIHPRR